MTIISFFTSCITKATSELSERSWACKEDKGCLNNPQAHHGWAKQDWAGQSYYNLVVQRALLRELRKGQWSVRGSRPLIKKHESFRTLHDITECHTDTPFYLLLHPTSFTYPPDPSLRGNSQGSLHWCSLFTPDRLLGIERPSSRRVMWPEKCFRKVTLVGVWMVHWRGQA